jgi:flagella basal body P-ring formation protein FlgA
LLRAAIAGLLAITFAADAPAEPRMLPVPRVTLYPGDAIAAEQLAERPFAADLVNQTAVHVEREALVGKLARRTLLAGQPIPRNAVREPYLVTQGRAVQLVFKSGGLTITGVGVALQSAGGGELISVRNVDSGIIVRGTVQADGSVRVGGP